MLSIAGYTSPSSPSLPPFSSSLPRPSLDSGTTYHSGGGRGGGGGGGSLCTDGRGKGEKGTSSSSSLPQPTTSTTLTRRGKREGRKGKKSKETRRRRREKKKTFFPFFFFFFFLLHTLPQHRRSFSLGTPPPLLSFLFFLAEILRRRRRGRSKKEFFPLSRARRCKVLLRQFHFWEGSNRGSVDFSFLCPISQTVPRPLFSPGQVFKKTFASSSLPFLFMKRRDGSRKLRGEGEYVCRLYVQKKSSSGKEKRGTVDSHHGTFQLLFYFPFSPCVGNTRKSQ